MNKTVNVCKFFLESSTSPLMKSIYDEMIRRGLNINSCPVPPGSYFTRGFHVNDNKFPPILPTGRVFIKIDYLTGSSERNLKLLSSIELTATIKNSLSKALRIKGWISVFIWKENKEFLGVNLWFISYCVLVLLKAQYCTYYLRWVHGLDSLNQG